MPRRIFRPGRVADSAVVALLETVMARWRTNHPLLAVGGFSYSRPSEEWLQALDGHTTFFVSSATVSERDAAFTLHFRRSRDGAASDEWTLSWREGEAAGFGSADAARLEGLVEGLTPALPAPLTR